MLWFKLKKRLGRSFLHPRHIAQEELRQFVLAEGPGLRGRLLDIGCGKKPYAEYFTAVEAHVGVDVPSTMHGLESVEAVATALALPFQDSSFDSVVCTEVLEHTPDPLAALREMWRVSTADATLLVTVPLSEQLHEEPFDFYRFTKYGLEHLLRISGWRIVRCSARGGAWLELGYRLSSLLYSVVGAHRDAVGGMKPRLLLGPPVVVLCAAIQVLAALLDQLWSAPVSTIGYSVVATKRSDFSASKSE
jgi:SAM-dependent methyltransferase